MLSWKGLKLSETPDFLALRNQLYRLINTAEVVPYIESSLPGWVPSEHECHTNADNWVKRNPGSKTIRGWIYFNALGMFTAHSVVEDENGVLMDITPSGASQRYPFIRHPGSEREFAELIGKYQIRNLYH